MTNSLFSLLARWEGFWLLRAGFHRLVFFFRVQTFDFQRATHERGAEARIFAGLFRAVLWQFAWAIVIVAALHWSDSHLRPLFIQRGWIIPMDDGYATLLSTIAGIGGVFIGLYYTALSTVGGAIYARVPNNIRNLLAHDRIGNLYINFLSILTFSCILLVASHAIGWGRIQSAAFVAAIFAGAGILSFVQLGRRAFNFFDPTSLSGTVIEQLDRAVKIAGHSDKNFQYHAHRLTVDGIATLKTLGDICAKEPHLQGEPYAQFSRQVIQFLLFYQTVRCQIPTTSLWHAQKHIHKEWHAHNSMADVCYAAGMPLHPEVARDVGWLEDSLLPIVRQCLQVNLADKKWEIVLKVLPDCAQFSSALASLRQVDTAATMIRADSKIILDQILPPSEDIVTDEWQEEVGIVEQVAALPANILISYCNTLQHVRKEILTELVGGIAWHRRDAVYELQFPPHLLPCLEELKSHLDFERQVEGEIITPIWYQGEMVAREEADKFFSNAKALFEDFPALLAEWGDVANKSKRLWTQAVIVGAEWRYHRLMNMRLNELKAAHESITGNRRTEEDMVWRTVDFSAYQKKCDEHCKKTLQRMAMLAPILLQFRRPEWVPDYPGQFMRYIGDEAMHSLIDNDVETLRLFFASYSTACFQQFYRMREKIESWDERAIIKVRAAFAPLRDLLSLSGYACLMSELHDAPVLWEEVVKGWDVFLKQWKDSSKKGDSTVNILPQILVLMLRDMKRALTYDAGDNFRFAWQRMVASKLFQIGREIPKDWNPSSAEGLSEKFGILPDIPDKVVDHPSKLVRHCAEYCQRGMPGGGMPGGEDIFVLYYLRKHPDSEGVDFKEWDHLSRSIERA